MIALPDGCQDFILQETQYMGTAGIWGWADWYDYSLLSNGYTPENAAPLGVFHSWTSLRNKLGNQKKRVDASRYHRSQPITLPWARYFLKSSLLAKLLFFRWVLCLVIFQMQRKSSFFGASGHYFIHIRDSWFWCARTSALRISLRSSPRELDFCFIIYFSAGIF